MWWNNLSKICYRLHNCNEIIMGRESYDTLYVMNINFHPTSNFVCTYLYFTYYYCKLTSFGTFFWYSKKDWTMYVCNINYLHTGHGLQKNMESWPFGVHRVWRNCISYLVPFTIDTRRKKMVPIIQFFLCKWVKDFIGIKWLDLRGNTAL
jgi:hypothetical protein